MSSIRGVLFDLDGTLLDSAPDLVGSLNHIRNSEGLAPLPVDKFRQFVSHGAVGLLKSGMPETDEQTFERWRQAFLVHYAANYFVKSGLFDGVGKLLAFLEQSAIPWGIVTNKIEKYTRPIMVAAKLDSKTSCVVCGDTLKETKPHPAPVTLACELLKVNPSNVLFVGDDPRDLQAGRSAGTQIAAVHYGYGRYDAADVLVKQSFQIYHPEDLIGVVAGR